MAKERTAPAGWRRFAVRRPPSSSSVRRSRSSSIRFSSGATSRDATSFRTTSRRSGRSTTPGRRGRCRVWTVHASGGRPARCRTRTSAPSIRSVRSSRRCRFPLAMRVYPGPALAGGGARDDRAPPRASGRRRARSVARRPPRTCSRESGSRRSSTRTSTPEWRCCRGSRGRRRAPASTARGPGRSPRPCSSRSTSSRAIRSRSGSPVAACVAWIVLETPPGERRAGRAEVRGRGSASPCSPRLRRSWRARSGRR